MGETRETAERKATLGFHWTSQFKYLSSYIDQYKGGISLLVKYDFLKRFYEVDVKRDWCIIIPGRLARLALYSGKGTIHIYVCYFDPTSTGAQVACIRRLAETLDDKVLAVIVGDFNFVESAYDRYVKSSASWSLGDDKPVAEAWSRLITPRGVSEWSQPYTTFENGLVCSRIDRIYSNLHAGNNLVGHISCFIMDGMLELSDHKPILCSFRHRTKTQRNTISQ